MKRPPTESDGVRCRIKSFGSTSSQLGSTAVGCPNTNGAVQEVIGTGRVHPAAGTGGFLVSSFDRLKKQARTVQQLELLQTESIYGGEAKPLPYLLCQMNLLLHGLEFPQIDPLNSLRHKLNEIGDDQRVDIILTNPPFGGEEERGILNNFPTDKEKP